MTHSPVINYLRQMSLVSPERLAVREVTVIGAGAIGSSVALALAKMGIERLTVFDPAVVKPHHLPSHLYRLRDVAQNKVEALRQIVADYTGVEITARAEEYSGQTRSSIIISTVTSIDSREAFWQDTIRLSSALDMYLDVWLDDRMMHLAAVRPYDPDDIEWYEEQLATARSQASSFRPSTLAFSTFFALAAEVGTVVKSVVTEGKIDRELIREHYGLILRDDPISSTVTVIGAGGIGSPTVLALAKLGVRHIVVYDDDAVEDHNLPSQWYRLRDVGRPKVDALQAIVRDFTGIVIEARPERFTAHTAVNGIVIAAVDSMDTRIEIFDVVARARGVELFMDGRMGGEQFYLYTIRPNIPDHVRWYQDRLYPSSQAVEIPCSARAIIYTLLGIASEIGLHVHQYAFGGNPVREVIRDLPTGLRERG